MESTKQKITLARRAIVEMRRAEGAMNRDDFEYHFSAFLAFMGTLRQFITVKPHKQWAYDQDEQNLNYCAMLDLRNLDIHVQAIPNRAAYEVNINDNLGGGPAALSSTSVTYYVNIDGLDSTFAVLRHNNSPRSTKIREIALLKNDSAIDVATRALDFLEKTVLPASQSEGIRLP